MCHIIHLRMQSRYILSEGPGVSYDQTPSRKLTTHHPSSSRAKQEAFSAASKTFLMASCLCCHQIQAPFLSCASSVLSSCPVQQHHLLVLL